MKKQATKESRRAELWVYGFLIAAVLGVLMGFTLDICRGLKDWDSGLPRLYLGLDGLMISDINAGSKDEKYTVLDVSLTIGGEKISYGGAKIKGRGNSTWEWKKKPYQITLDEKADILGLGRRRKWILLANYIDDTVGLRNDMAFKLADMLEEQYSPHGEFVELFVNGAYEGVYYLTSKIEISKNSVDLRGNYGVLAEIDYLHGWSETVYLSDSGAMLIFKDAVYEDDEDIYEKAISKFMDSFNRFESALNKGDYEEIKRLIDVESFVIFYLVNEFTVDPDAYSSNFYLYSDGDDDKIHAGPVWDFDYAFGNRRWGGAKEEDFYSPYQTRYREREVGKNEKISDIFYKLMKIDEFRSGVSSYFRKNMSGRKAELLEYYDGRMEYLEKAAVIDGGKFLDKDRKSYSEATLELRNWISDRFDYFEEVYGL